MTLDPPSVDSPEIAHIPSRRKFVVSIREMLDRVLAGGGAFSHSHQVLSLFTASPSFSDPFDYHRVARLDIFYFSGVSSQQSVSLASFGSPAALLLHSCEASAWMSETRRLKRCCG